MQTLVTLINSNSDLQAAMKAIIDNTSIENRNGVIYINEQETEILEF